MQRQLRLGDILDDYCPRERRVTNHAIVAMMGPDVKQTRCTTCEAEHEYKRAKVPRQRRKTETPAALYATVLAGGPKRVVHGEELVKEPATEAALEGSNGNGLSGNEDDVFPPSPPSGSHLRQDGGSGGQVGGTSEPVNGGVPVEDEIVPAVDAVAESPDEEDGDRDVEEDGPVHRPLIRASLPRPEGTPPPQRPAPDFTIRQPGGRPANRFRPRHPRGGQPFQSQGQSNRGNGNMGGGPSRGGMPRHGGGRPPGAAPTRLARRNGPGRKRSK